MIYNSDGSPTDVQAKIDLASAGDIVTIPIGSFTWTMGITIDKPIHLQGLGTAGAIVGRSVTAVPVGTGTKVFTVDTGLDITAGQTLRIWKTGGDINPLTAAGMGTWPWMECTVTSYASTTLTMNITSTNGSGTLRPWHITTPATTTIVNNVVEPGNTIEIGGTFSTTPEISNIRFEPGTGSGEYVILNPVGYPALIHDCFFTVYNAGGCIYSRTNMGVVWNCYFVDRNWSRAPLAFKHKFYFTNESWESASTMGALDTTGTANFYFEDCWFVGFLNATDFDDNSRAVVRHCVCDHSGLGTHGADTGTPAIGARHYEVYANTFYFDDFGAETIPMVWWIYMRGGTGLFNGNAMPLISSSQWGAKLSYNMTIQNLQRHGQFGCWGFGEPTPQYPAPRQVGRGNPNGTAVDLDPLGLTVMGDLEPFYTWGNSGAGADVVGITDFGWSPPSSCGSTEEEFNTEKQSSEDYIVEDRDYYVGTPKPGWTAAPYPQIWRSGSGAIEINNLTVAGLILPPA